MKKLYTLLMCGVISFGAIAQTFSPNQLPHQGPNVNKNIRFNKTKFESNKNRLLNPNTASTQSVWINYAVAMDSLNGHLGSGAGIQANYLFWDSLALGDFGGNFSAIWINNLGNVVDLTSTNLQNYGGVPTTWGAWNAYTVDSMGLVYAYIRHIPNPNIVDTLIVKLYTSVPATNFNTSYYAGGNTQTNYNTDTLTVKLQKYTYTTNAPNASGVVTIKVLLDGTDTAVTYYREKDWTTNFNVAPGKKLIASSITFKPGYAYNLGDTVTTQLNEFLFTAYEENGAGTYPYFQDCNLASAGCDYNCSGIVTTGERYNISQYYNGFFVPKYAYTAPYTLENHLVSYKITSTNVGINEQGSANAYLGQNMPNPFNGNTTIGYELANGGNVSLNVFDVTGKSVMNFNQGKQPAGKYSVQISGSDLQAGVYFYTLTVDGEKITKKMTVVK